MQPFTTSTLLTKKDYTKYLYTYMYKKPYYIITSLFGLALFMFGAIVFVTGNTDGITQVVVGSVFILFPTFMVRISRKTTFAKPALMHPFVYTFSEDAINIKGYAFETNYTWEHVLKITETTDFLLLYSSKVIANFVKKDGLTRDQIDFIKSKAPGK